MVRVSRTRLLDCKEKSAKCKGHSQTQRHNQALDHAPSPPALAWMVGSPLETLEVVMTHEVQGNSVPVQNPA